MPFVNLVGPSYQVSETNLSPQRTINYYIETHDVDGVKVPKVLKTTPGVQPSNIPLPGVQSVFRGRGMYLSATGYAPDYLSLLYAVFGSTIVRVNQEFNDSEQIGTLTDTGLPVNMTDDGFNVLIVDGELMHAFDMKAQPGDTSSFKIIEMPYLPDSSTERARPTHVAYLNNRIIVNGRGTNAWFFSKLGETEFVTDVSGTDWYQAEQNSDNILALKAVNGNLLILGQRSYEIWRGTDNQDDPFAFVSGSQTAIGILAPYSLAVCNDLTFWLGGSDVGSGSVWMLKGTTPVRISDPGIEDQIYSISSQEAAEGYAYSKGGMTFYILTFREANRTFVYEVSTGTWCERLSRDVNSGDWLAYRYGYPTFANNRIYVMDMTVGAPNIGYFDEDKHTEIDGTVIMRQRIAPVWWDSLNDIIIDEIMLDMQVGTTSLLEGQGSDPKILLELSRDGGMTYGPISERSMGQQGRYTNLVRWRSRGRGRAIVAKFTVTEPVSHGIYMARLDYKVCKRT